MTKGDRTRATVLGSAMSLATQVGLEGLTIGTLADHVGMSKSGLFSHFASKQNLQRAVLQEATGRFMALVVAPALKKPRGEARVRALFDNWLAWSKAEFMPGGCIFVRAGAELGDRPGPVRDRYVASQKDWLGVLSAAARTAVDDKHFRKDVDVEQIAVEIYSIAVGYHSVRRVLDPIRAERRARAAFDRLIAGLRPPT